LGGKAAIAASTGAARPGALAPDVFDRFLAVGALLIAGFFTFPFDRPLGRWLFG